jgi:hypothetical protein
MLLRRLGLMLRLLSEALMMMRCAQGWVATMRQQQQQQQHCLQARHQAMPLIRCWQLPPLRTPHLQHLPLAAIHVSGQHTALPPLADLHQAMAARIGGPRYRVRFILV